MLCMLKPDFYSEQMHNSDLEMPKSSQSHQMEKKPFPKLIHPPSTEPGTQSTKPHWALDFYHLTWICQNNLVQDYHDVL
jgi:hypothetical protein